MSASSIPGSERKATSKLRFQRLNAFVDIGMTAADLTPAAMVVWFVLYRFVDAKTGLATVATDTIRERTGFNRKTVTRALSCLKKANLVKIKRSGGINRGATSYLIRSSPPARP